MKNLSNAELTEINGGDNCPAKKDQGVGYYIGYSIGWLVEVFH
ncbi:hypothetical protein [Chryseobacterium indologenes]|nr:hypothetical protein [Chryseobacterium indologenes]